MVSIAMVVGVLGVQEDGLEYGLRFLVGNIIDYLFTKNDEVSLTTMLYLPTAQFRSPFR